MAWGVWDGADYKGECDALEITPALRGVEFKIDGMATIVWDMPTGTAEVWRQDANSLILSRPWFDPNADINQVGYQLATLPAQNRVRLGSLELRTGWLLIVWAAEDGADIMNVSPADGLALDLSVGHAGVIAALPAGRYTCYHDEVSARSSSAQRCLIVVD